MARSKPARQAPERTVTAVPRFNKSKRRLTAGVQAEVDEQVKALLVDPLKGEPKHGALRGVRVTKFNASNQQYLLAYFFHERPNILEMLDVGVHENFYSGVENYLKER